MRYAHPMVLKRDIAQLASFAGEALAETLWPTRCAVCDALGAVLCDRCRQNLAYVDWWRACKRCGSPYGLVQCDMCNSLSLQRLGIERLPFDSCASAVHFGGDTGQIVRVFKDQGEQRLANDMASLMQRVIAPDWAIDALTFVPATAAAVRRRGYDHAELLARALARALGAPCIRVLGRPQARDQRSLAGRERVVNLRGKFGPCEHDLDGRCMLIIDDVFTTGATLCAASQALRDAGAGQVRAVTFARV